MATKYWTEEGWKGDREPNQYRCGCIVEEAYPGVDLKRCEHHDEEIGSTLNIQIDQHWINYNGHEVQIIGVAHDKSDSRKYVVKMIDPRLHLGLEYFIDEKGEMIGNDGVPTFLKRKLDHRNRKIEKEKQEFSRYFYECGCYVDVANLEFLPEICHEHGSALQKERTQPYEPPKFKYAKGQLYMNREGRLVTIIDIGANDKHGSNWGKEEDRTWYGPRGAPEGEIVGGLKDLTKLIPTEKRESKYSEDSWNYKPGQIYVNRRHEYIQVRRVNEYPVNKIIMTDDKGRDYHLSGCTVDDPAGFWTELIQRVDFENPGVAMVENTAEKFEEKVSNLKHWNVSKARRQGKSHLAAAKKEFKKLKNEIEGWTEVKLKKLEPTGIMFVVGQIWEDRGGRRRTITRVECNSDFIELDSGSVFSKVFRVTGRHHHGVKTEDNHINDLMYLIQDADKKIEEGTIKRTYKSDVIYGKNLTPDKIEFEIGQQWETRGGGLITITGIRSVIAKTSSGSSVYLDNGKFFNYNKKSKHDLMYLVKGNFAISGVDLAKGRDYSATVIKEVSCEGTSIKGNHKDIIIVDDVGDWGPEEKVAEQRERIKSSCAECWKPIKDDGYFVGEDGKKLCGVCNREKVERFREAYGKPPACKICGGKKRVSFENGTVPCGACNFEFTKIPTWEEQVALAANCRHSYSIPAPRDHYIVDQKAALMDSDKPNHNFPIVTSTSFTKRSMRVDSIIALDSMPEARKQIESLSHQLLADAAKQMQERIDKDLFMRLYGKNLYAFQREWLNIPYVGEPIK